MSSLFSVTCCYSLILLLCSFFLFWKLPVGHLCPQSMPETLALVFVSQYPSGWAWPSAAPRHAGCSQGRSCQAWCRSAHYYLGPFLSMCPATTLWFQSFQLLPLFSGELHTHEYKVLCELHFFISPSVHSHCSFISLNSLQATDCAMLVCT